MPDILSKNAFVSEKPKLENMNGSEPKIAILNQDNAVRRKACCKLSFFSWSKFDKKNKVPKTIVTIVMRKRIPETPSTTRHTVEMGLLITTVLGVVKSIGKGPLEAVRGTR